MNDRFADAGVSATMRLGSLTLLLRGAPGRHVFDMLEDEFEEAPHLLNDRESLTAASTVDAVVEFVVEDACASSGAVPPDGMVVQWHPTGCTIRTEALVACVDTRLVPARVQLTVVAGVTTSFEFKVHLAVVLTRVVFALGRLRLHSAAVAMDGKAALFVGGKGAGKSTVSIALARCGGTVLSDDFVLLARSDLGFTASGCVSTLRMLSDTRRHFFGDGLEGSFVQAANGIKTQVRIQDHLTAAPYVDYPVGGLFFPHPGGRFEIRSTARQRAFLVLIEQTRRAHRVADKADHQTYLGFLAALVQSVPPFDVELSPDFTGLDELAEFVTATVGGGSS